MAYCTLTDIEAPEGDLIQLTDDVGVGVVDEVVVARAISHAGELIDGYLRGRSTLPLEPIPGLLTTLAATITLRRLYARGGVVKVPEALQDDYKNSLKILENIQKGTISLGVGVPETVVATAAGISVVAPERVFSRETLTDY